MAIAYNVRPSRSNVYKNTKKPNFIIRLLRGFIPMKGDDLFEVIRKIIFIAALGAFIYYGGDIVYKFFNEISSDMETKKAIEKINMNGTVDMNDPVVRDVLNQKPEMLPEYIQLYSENNDLVGHIMLGNPSLDGDYLINYPVYQAEDNDYYLKNTPQHKFSDGGSIFADYRNKFTVDGISPNVILYGHNMFTGSYFTKLTRYYTGHDKTRYKGDDLDFYRDYPTLTFNTLYEKAEWKIFACALMNVDEIHGEVYDYTNMLSFPNEDSFNQFVLDTMDRSVFFTDVDLTYGDNILTLSTCYEPYNIDTTRCVIFARKVREGESASVNVSKSVLNNAELRWRGQVERIGTNWAGRTWDTNYLLSYDG